MKDYFANRWFKTGFWLAAIGWTPLWSVVLLSNIGLWPDPNPNPIGFGLLFFFSFWPAVVCLGIGVFQVVRRKA